MNAKEKRKKSNAQKGNIKNKKKNINKTKGTLQP
jgi:hypothetical protein